MNPLDTKRNSVRQIAQSIMNDFGFSEANLGWAINEVISKGSFSYIRVLGGKAIAENNKVAVGKAWKDIWGQEGKTQWNNIDKWTELERVFNQIISDRNGSNSNNLKTDKANSSNPTIQSSDQEFTKKYVFGLLKYQDTILPLFFLDTYRRRFPNMEFKTFGTWEEIAKEMLAGRVHFTIHNLHTVVSFNLLNPKNTLAYLPKFSFHGYQVFLKILGGNSLAAQQNELLEELKVIVEKENDFEWIWIKYCQLRGCDLDKIRANIIYENVNIAKKRFIEEDEIGIYCTNSIHAKELQKQPLLYESVGYGEQLTQPEHKNSNGIACLTSFYNKNTEIAKEMRQVWFDIMKTTFIPQIKKAMRTINLNQPPEEVILIEAIMNKLNKITGAKIDSTDFYQMFRTSNSFHTNPQNAKSTFLTQTKDTKIMENYKEIVQIQTQNQFSDDEINGAIKNIINQVLAS